MKWNHPHTMSKAPFSVDRLSLSEYHIALQKGCSSDDSEAGKFSSWISVAWYPIYIYIYKIPTGPTLRGVGFTNGPIITYLNGMDGDCKISLPVFYMVSYKLKGSMWVTNRGCEHQLSNSLLKAVDSWQRLLQ
ncbi:hypothetical protein FRX31_009332, partial [Thalictrum thalictroides]